MLGFRTIGAAPVCGLPGASRAVPGTPAMVSLGGQQVRNWRALTINDTLGGRGTLTVEIMDLDCDIHPDPGESVQVSWNGLVLFEGTVDSTDEEITEKEDLIILSLRCVDHNQLCDRFHVSNAYLGKTVREIVDDIISIQTPLREEGVILGEVDTDIVIDKIVFPWRKVTDCFRDLGEQANLSWNIREGKILDFFDRSTFTAEFDLGTGGRNDYRKLSYQKKREQYRNREILRGGNDLTDEITDRFRGSAATTETSKRDRTFNTRLPVGSTPEIFRNGVAQRVGLRGVDKDGELTLPTPTTWPQWFFSIGANEVSQNSADDEALNPTLAAEDVLEVTYQGQFPMLVIEDDLPEIAARAAIEGGTGIYEFLDEDTELDGRDFGQAKAQKLLALYGRIPAELAYEIDNPYLRPGHLQDVDIPTLGISAQFLVDQVQINFPTPYLPRCQYRLLDGERLQGWSDYFRKLIESGRKLVVRENEVAIKAQRPTETIEFSDSLDTEEAESLTDYLEDPYTVAIFKQVVVSGSGQLLPGFIYGRSRFGKPAEFAVSVGRRERIRQARRGEIRRQHRAGWFRRSSRP